MRKVVYSAKGSKLKTPPICVRRRNFIQLNLIADSSIIAVIDVVGVVPSSLVIATTTAAATAATAIDAAITQNGSSSPSGCAAAASTTCAPPDAPLTEPAVELLKVRNKLYCWLANSFSLLVLCKSTFHIPQFLQNQPINIQSVEKNICNPTLLRKISGQAALLIHFPGPDYEIVRIFVQFFFRPNNKYFLFQAHYYCRFLQIL